MAVRAAEWLRRGFEEIGGRMPELPGTGEGSAGHDDDSPGKHADEDLERQRTADAELVSLLAQQEFSGPLYEKFELKLYGYGKPVLIAWLRTGEIFAQCRRRNLRLSAPPRRLTSDDRTHLADHTLAAALPVFRQRSLIEGGWSSGKAALTTYFVNGLPIHFSNVYRSWCRQVRKEIDWLGQVKAESDLADVPDITVTSDPQQLYILRETVQEELSWLDAATRGILIMLNEGYRYAEIAEVHGMSARAVEAVVYRHRKRMLRRPENELG